MNFQTQSLLSFTKIVIVLFCAVWINSAVALTYNLTRIGLDVGVTSMGGKINNSGQVIGITSTASNELHSFIYTPGIGAKDIGTLGGVSTSALSINDAGQIVGDSVTANGEKHAFFYSESTGMQDLGTLGGTQSSASSINNLGQIAGTSTTGSGDQHAFLYSQSNGMQDIGSLGGANIKVSGITDAGLVVGSAGGKLFNSHVFVYSSTGGMQDISPSNSDFMYINGFNNLGQIVGYVATTGQGFIYTPGSGFQFLITPNYNVNYWATGINNYGQVIGWLSPTYNPNQYGYIYTVTEGIRQIDTMISGIKDWSSLAPTSINELGQIVGTGVDYTSSNSFAFVMTPDVQVSTVNVAAGWNLLGTMDTINVASYFGNAANISTVWKWLPTSSGWAFYAPSFSDGGAAYAASKGYTFLTTINGGEGFWVNASKPFTTAMPIVNTPGTTISLLPGLPTGWNLMSLGKNTTPSAFNQSIGYNNITLLGQPAPANFATLWAWDSALSSWYFYAPALDIQGGTVLTDYILSKSYLNFTSVNRTLGPGMGFWVNKQ
jgi:probable HAF family extracellular repeat protein